ncbi:MAG: hypothetical protein AB7L84_09855 [Acidimicrobiia bacterium]
MKPPLLAAKLAALVRARWGEAPRQPHEVPWGAALVGTDEAWALVEDVRAFGPALVWAERAGVGRLHVVADASAGVLARRAAQFHPAPEVWAVAGTSLVPAEPEPVPSPAVAPGSAEAAGLLVDAGLEVLVEDGIVRGEVNGLEVARVVDGRLQVGVGQADRELTALVHGELDPVDQLDRVVAIARHHRRADAPPHPLKDLVPERWLRAQLVAEPSRIGLRELHPAPTAVPRPNLRDRHVAAARGVDAGGGEVVVVFSVGVDLDLVPAAADTRAVLAPGADLWLVVPARDAHPVTQALVERLAVPGRVVPVAGDWREAA